MTRFERRWEKRCHYCLELNWSGTDTEIWKCKFCGKEFFGKGYPTEATKRSMWLKGIVHKRQSIFTCSVAKET